MRIFAALLAVAAISTDALGAEKAPAAAPAPTVLMSPMALPVIQDGKLVNYIYVNLRLGLSSTADGAKMRDMEPFFRDAIVRAAYRTSIVQAANPNALDHPRFTSLVIAESNRVAGKGSVVKIQILREQPQKYLPLRTGASKPVRPKGRPTPP